jgi:ribosomal protein L37AE/L43A
LSIDEVVSDLKDSWNKSNEQTPRICPNCGREMYCEQATEDKSTWVCSDCGREFEESKPKPMEKLPLQGKAWRYFLHGFVFSLLFIPLEIAWMFAAVFLTSVGFIIGLVIAIGLLFLGIGYLNTLVAGFVWGYAFDNEFTEVLVHGFVLSLIFLGIGLVVSWPLMAYASNWIVFVARALIFCFLYGIAGRSIAEMYTI